MDRLLSEQAVLEAIEHALCEEWIKALYRSIVQAIPSAEPEWIPVSESPKEECQKVLIWERYYSHKRERYVADYNFGWLYKDNWMCEGGGESEVIAWMPLPEPWKGESE